MFELLDPGVYPLPEERPRRPLGKTAQVIPQGRIVPA